MTTLQAFLLGVMVVLTPSLLVLAWLLIVHDSTGDKPWRR